MQQFALTLEQKSIKLETIICLAGAWAYAPENLRELFDSGDEGILVEAGLTPSEVEEIGKTEDWEALSDLLTAKELTGFLVHASTPVPRGVELKDGEPVSGVYSWGYCQTQWFCCESLDDDFATLLADWRDAIWRRVYEKEAQQ